MSTPAATRSLRSLPTTFADFPTSAARSSCMGPAPTRVSSKIGWRRRESVSSGSQMNLAIPWRAGILPFLASHWVVVIRFLATSFSRTLTTIAVIFLIREFLSGVLADRHGVAASLATAVGATAALWIVVAALLTTLLIGAMLNYDNRIVAQRIARLVELTLMERLIRHLLTLSVAFFLRHRHSDILESVRQDVVKVRLAVMALVELSVQSLQAVAYLGAVVVLSPRLTTLSLPILLVAAGPVWWVARRVRMRSFRVRRHGFLLSDLLLQLMRGISIVKVYAGEQTEARANIARTRAYFDDLIEVSRLQSLGYVALEALSALSMVVITIVGGFEVMRGSLSWPALLALLIAVRALHGPLAVINNQYIEVQRHWASARRLRELFTTTPEVHDRPHAIPLTEPIRTIRVEHVCFRYGPGSTALDDVSFEI